MKKSCSLKERIERGESEDPFGLPLMLLLLFQLPSCCIYFLAVQGPGLRFPVFSSVDAPAAFPLVALFLFLPFFLDFPFPPSLSLLFPRPTNKQAHIH